jgi:hypothetical protein
MKALMLQKITDIQFCPQVASTEFNELLIQLAINVIVLLIISRFIYYRWNRNAEYLFAQLITGFIVFVICALLRWVKLELGLVLGLFAIFAIIRFRTINIPVKEMAYMFMVVGISAVNALLPVGECFQWIAISNVILILLVLILESYFFQRNVTSRSIIISNTDLLKPSKHEMLMQELKSLTELDIIKIDIGKVDYIKKHAIVRIYFRSNHGSSYIENNSLPDDD